MNPLWNLNHHNFNFFSPVLVCSVDSFFFSFSFFCRLGRRKKKRVRSSWKSFRPWKHMSNDVSEYLFTLKKASSTSFFLITKCSYSRQMPPFTLSSLGQLFIRTQRMASIPHIHRTTSWGLANSLQKFLLMWQNLSSLLITLENGHQEEPSLQATRCSPHQSSQ